MAEIWQFGPLHELAAMCFCHNEKAWVLTNEDIVADAHGIVCHLAAADP
jgi:hypothetical protein